MSLNSQEQGLAESQVLPAAEEEELPQASEPVDIPKLAVSCLKCKHTEAGARQLMSDGVLFTNAHNRQMLKGTCDTCGTRVTRLMANK